MDDETEVETREGEELPSEEAPQEEPSLEDRFQKLQAEIDEERRKHAQETEQWQTRYQETHSWANQANMRALAAERQVLAMQPYQPQRDDLAVPTVSDEELERFADDPKLVWEKMKEASDYTARFIMRQIGPVLQMVPALASMHEGQVEILREVAVDLGRKRATASGLKREEYDRNLRDAYGIMVAASKGDAIALRNMETNPEVIFQAVNMARTRNGVPVVQPERPPTIGAGGGNRRTAPATPARNEAVAEMEGIFGKKFSDDQLRTAAAAAKKLETERSGALRS